MFKELLRKLGWVRITELNDAALKHEYQMSTMFANLTVREEHIRSLKQHLRTALAPSIAPYVRAHVKGAGVAHHTEYTRMFDVYTVRLPEVVLRCNTEFWWKCKDDPYLAEIVCAEWEREFHKVLPDVVRKLQ